MTIGNIRENIKKELASLYPEREITGITRILFEYRMGLPQHETGLQRDRELGEADVDWFKQALARLKENEPVQHITGLAEFYGLLLRVNRDVLVPRPETEELVDWIVQSGHGGVGQGGVGQSGVGQGGGLRILDIGTGSGNIALALARNLENPVIFATDISEPALAIASENARTHGCAIELRRHDILSRGSVEESPGTDIAEDSFPEMDIIVSNPPYIPSGEAGSLHANVREYDPPGALFVPDMDPLLYYRNICSFAREKLKKGGWLYLEIHEKYGKQAVRLLEEHGLTRVEMRIDLNRKDRLVRGQKP
jgi:release factor glutamine methyltransferase